VILIFAFPGQVTIANHWHHIKDNMFGTFIMVTQSSFGKDNMFGTFIIVTQSSFGGISGFLIWTPLRL